MNEARYRKQWMEAVASEGTELSLVEWAEERELEAEFELSRLEDFDSLVALSEGWEVVAVEEAGLLEIRREGNGFSSDLEAFEWVRGKAADSPYHQQALELDWRSKSDVETHEYQVELSEETEIQYMCPGGFFAPSPAMAYRMAYDWFMEQSREVLATLGCVVASSVRGIVTGNGSENSYDGTP